MNNRNNYHKKEVIKNIDKPSERQMKAENYLKEYDIQNILTEMINYLLHKRSKTPILEMIKYLAGLLTEKEREEYKIIIPSFKIDYHPLIEYPNFQEECNSLLKECLDMNIFLSLRDNITKYGTNLGSLMKLNEINPKNNFGIFLSDMDCIKKFRELFSPIISKAHNLDNKNLKFFTENNFNLNNLKFDDIKKINLDEIKGLNKINISISRNLYDEPFITFLNVENRNENVLNKLQKELKKIKYFKNEMNHYIDDNNENIILKKINFDFNFFNAINNKEKLVKNYRKIYSNGDNSSLLLINYCDNFHFIKSIFFSEEKNNEKKITVNDIFIKAFNDLNDFIRNLQYYIGFEFEHNFGYLTSNIALLGYGFNIKCEINLNKLLGDKYDLNKINKILDTFDRYSDNYDIKNISPGENILIFSSSPKISQSSISEFLVEYFEKILKLKND